MANVPIIVSGTISSSSGNNADEALIKFTYNSESEIYTTGSDGKYLVDLQNIDVSKGDTVSYSVYDK